MPPRFPMDTVLVLIRHRKFSGEARLRHLPFLHGSTGIRDKINATVLRTVATRESEKNRLEIPDHALDFHTKRGRKMGHVIDAAGWDHWAELGCKLTNEVNRLNIYRDRALVAQEKARTIEREARDRSAYNEGNGSGIQSISSRTGGNNGTPVFLLF